MSPMATESEGGSLPAVSKWRRILQSLSGSLEMPREVILDVPRATVIGSMQVQVENHKGVLQFSPTCVRIRTRDGEMVVSGSRLKIGCIFRDEVVVEGRIDRIDLVDASELRTSPYGTGRFT